MNFDPHYPSIILSLTALMGGLVMLTGGGEFLVSGAGKLAKRLGMSSLLIGLTVVAFGTSMPELFVGLLALFQDHPDILTGNAIGSNIANVGLILGVCALITPLPVRFQSVSRELYIVLATTILVYLAAWHGSFPRLLGFFFVGGIIFYTVHNFRQASNNRKPATNNNVAADTPSNTTSLARTIILTVMGLGLLPLGSHFFIRGAVDVARYFRVSELVIGLTLAAVGTSLPELASCLAAIRQNQTNILTGNIIGSNLFNLLMVMGFCGLLQPYPLSSNLLLRDIPVMFSLSAVLLPILAVQHGLKRIHGAILLLSYLGYLYILG
jgi:cation:H+ antiporter